jgi:hypothetical protein
MAPIEVEKSIHRNLAIDYAKYDRMTRTAGHMIQRSMIVGTSTMIVLGSESSGEVNHGGRHSEKAVETEGNWGLC